MARYLMIDQSGRVVNAVEWDGDTKKWQPPEGITMLRNAQGEAASLGQIGDSYDGVSFAPPAPKVPELSKEEVLANELKALKDELLQKGVIEAKVDAVVG